MKACFIVWTLHTFEFINENTEKPFGFGLSRKIISVSIFILLDSLPCLIVCVATQSFSCLPFSGFLAPLWPKKRAILVTPAWHMGLSDLVVNEYTIGLLRHPRRYLFERGNSGESHGFCRLPYFECLSFHDILCGSLVLHVVGIDWC